MHRTKSTHWRTPAWVVSFVAFGTVALSPALALASGGGDGAWSDWYWPILGMVVNLAILGYCAKRFAGKGFTAYLKNRKSTIERDIDEAAALRKKAQEQLDDIEARMSSLDDERSQILDEYREAGEAEKARIIADAEAQAKRIQEEARKIAETEATQAQKTIEQAVLEQALALAEETLKDRIKPKTHRDLVNQTIDSIATMSDGS